MKRRPLLFLDTSVLLAAVFSQSGGSSGIVDLAKKGRVVTVMTETVMIEGHRKLKQKYGPRELNVLYRLLVDLKPSIKPTPAREELEKFDDFIIDRYDRHILAGAKKYKADYLITLDKKHFFTESLIQARLGFKIYTPRMFLNEFRQKLNFD